MVHEGGVELDSIEKATFEVDAIDIDTYGTSRAVGILRLEGDFTNAFEDYLGDMNATSITLQLNRKEAEELVKDIQGYLS
jgi:hypothetical protein